MREELMIGGYYSGQTINVDPENCRQLTMPAPSELLKDSPRLRPDRQEPVPTQRMLYVRSDWHVIGRVNYVYALSGMSPQDTWNAMISLAAGSGRLDRVRLLHKVPCPCGCNKFIVKPYFGCQCSSLSEREANELLAMARDAQRYRWLRDGNAFAPEEEGIRGGKQLDELCDEEKPLET